METTVDPVVRGERMRLLWAVAFYLLALAAQVSGFTNAWVALILAGIRF